LNIVSRVEEVVKLGWVYRSLQDALTPYRSSEFSILGGDHYGSTLMAIYARGIVIGDFT